MRSGINRRATPIASLLQLRLEVEEKAEKEMGPFSGALAAAGWLAGWLAGWPVDEARCSGCRQQHKHAARSCHAPSPRSWPFEWQPSGTVPASSSAPSPSAQELYPITAVCPPLHPPGALCAVSLKLVALKGGMVLSSSSGRGKTKQLAKQASEGWGAGAAAALLAKTQAIRPLARLC